MPLTRACWEDEREQTYDKQVFDSISCFGAGYIAGRYSIRSGISQSPFLIWGAIVTAVCFCECSSAFISWILEIYHGVKGKQYRFVAVIAVLGLLVIWVLLSRL